MNEIRTSIAENGRIVIPASFREALGIKPGEELFLRLEEDEVRITTARHRLAKAQALVRRYFPEGRLLSEELIQERREAAKRE